MKMITFLIYLFIVIELVLISIYFLIHYIKYRRRYSDMFVGVTSLLFSMSFLLYSFEHLHIETKLSQSIIDIILSITIAIFFILVLRKEETCHRCKK
jgi:hypothetical protein